MLPSSFDVKSFVPGPSQLALCTWEIACSLLLFNLEEILASVKVILFSPECMRCHRLACPHFYLSVLNHFTYKVRGNFQESTLTATLWAYFQLSLSFTLSCLSIAFWVPREVILCFSLLRSKDSWLRGCLLRKFGDSCMSFLWIGGKGEPGHFINLIENAVATESTAQGNLAHGGRPRSLWGEATAQPLSWGEKAHWIFQTCPPSSPQKPWLSVNLYFKEQESKKYRIWCRISRQRDQ